MKLTKGVVPWNRPALSQVVPSAGASMSRVPR
jgi:hypothetical protein